MGIRVRFRGEGFCFKDYVFNVWACQGSRCASVYTIQRVTYLGGRVRALVSKGQSFWVMFCVRGLVWSVVLHWSYGVFVCTQMFIGFHV